MFQKATKSQARLRFALCGPSGSGKTYSALKIACHLGKTIAVIDTEHGSASKYADLFDFDVCNLVDFHPGKYMEAIKAAGLAGYEVIVIDGLSHAWFAELDLAGKSFDGWKDVRPLERALIDAMLSSPAHIIATMRSKTEWVLEEYINKAGKTCVAPRKVGTSPIQSSGIEYEFDLAGEIDLNHLLTISKSRCPALSNTTHLNPGQE
ncbi:MAG: ATP-binding protein, partial [Nodosilinea sp.]